MISELKHTLFNEPRQWLITGAAGYVGTQLTKFLLDHNQKVIAFDNYEGAMFRTSSEFERHFPTHQQKRLELWNADVRNEYDLHHASNRKDVRHVVHLAALRSVPRSYQNPVEVADVNVMGTLNAARDAFEKKVESFVYASSSSVYGCNHDQRQSEWMVPDPISPYSRSKWAAEKLVETLDRGNTAVAGLRFFNIYGPGQDPESPIATVVPKFVDTLINHGVITFNGSKTIMRDFVHIKDVIQGIVRASLFSKESTAEIYNIGSGKSFTLDFIVDKIDRILETNYDFKSRYTTKQADYRIGDVMSTTANIDKAYHKLHYVPTVHLHEGLVEVIKAVME